MLTKDLDMGIKFTPEAVQATRELLIQKNVGSDFALRIYISGRTCTGFQYGLGLDNHPGENDKLFDIDGIKILVDDVSINYLDGASVDFIDDERGRGFVVDNPNPPPSCHCEDGTCG